MANRRRLSLKERQAIYDLTGGHCAYCNHYKRGMELEHWRAQLEAIPATLDRDCYTYRQGLRFGLIWPMPHKVKFYFEQPD